MGYDISFRANQSYGADALNSISSDFGVTPDTEFQNSVTYGVDALNNIRKDLVTKGIDRNVSPACACQISGSAVTIGGGKVFFASGVRAVVDANGMSVPYTALSSGYVWLEYSLTLGELALRYTEDAPSGDCVRIARIAGGIVFDEREYCSMKNPSLLPNKTKTFSNQTVQFTGTQNQKYLLKTLSVGETGYEQALIYSPSTTYGSFCGWIDLTTGTPYGVWGRSGTNMAVYADAAKGIGVYYANMQYYYVSAACDGTNLNLYGYSTSAGTWSVTLNIILF